MLRISKNFVQFYHTVEGAGYMLRSSIYAQRGSPCLRSLQTGASSLGYFSPHDMPERACRVGRSIYKTIPPNTSWSTNINAASKNR